VDIADIQVQVVIAAHQVDLVFPGSLVIRDFPLIQGDLDILEKVENQDIAAKPDGVDILHIVDVADSVDIQHHQVIQGGLHIPAIVDQADIQLTQGIVGGPDIVQFLDILEKAAIQLIQVIPDIAELVNLDILEILENRDIRGAEYLDIVEHLGIQVLEQVDIPE